MSPGWIVTLILVVLTVSSGWLAIRLIKEPGQHTGKVFAAGAERPLFRSERYDKLDRLAARYYMPDRALQDLYRVDRLLADIDSILRPVMSP